MALSVGPYSTRNLPASLSSPAAAIAEDPVPEERLSEHVGQVLGTCTQLLASLGGYHLQAVAAVGEAIG